MVTTLIIEGCMRKEQSSYKQCYEACAPYVYTIIKSYINLQELQKDVMQEVFANVFTNIEKFDPSKGKFKSWISQITVNKCIDTLKKEKRLGFIQPIDDEVESIRGEEKKLLESLDSQQIDELLKDMPTGYKTIFLLYVIDGYKHKEIAEIVNISTETSRSQLFRAIKWIQNNIQHKIKHIIYG